MYWIARSHVRDLKSLFCLFVCLFCFVFFGFVVELQDQVTFPTKISSKVKKLQLLDQFTENNMYVSYSFVNVETTFSNFQEGIHQFVLNYTDFATSHIKPSKYDSTSGTKISICLKKIGGWGCGSEQAPLITGVCTCVRITGTLNVVNVLVASIRGSWAW